MNNVADIASEREIPAIHRPGNPEGTMADRPNLRLSLPGLPGAVLLCGFFLFVVLFPAVGYSGQWRVVPARLFFERDAKSSVVTVSNEGDDKLTLQMKAMEWSQDAEGKDVYRDSNDILFFPRILLMEPKEEKIIRIGIKTPAAVKERTYRFFLEEIPQPKKDGQSDTAQIAIAVRFGVPIFVKPPKEELKAEITQLALANGIFTATVKNTGNAHFKIGTITISGKNDRGEETFSTKLDGWYLLNGAARTYSTTIPREKCSGTAKLDVTVSTDKQINLNRTLNVEKARCLP